MANVDLLVKDESAIKTPADLKGTVIGVGTADGAEVSFTRAIMTDLGMAEGTDYTFLPVGDGGTAAVGVSFSSMPARPAASDAAMAR